MTNNKTYIISLGGSLIVPPSGINWRFLKKFKTIIIREVKVSNKFYIVTGGGSTARTYIQAAKQITKVTSDDRDWLGIHATRLNAHLLRTIFREIAHPEIITNPNKSLSMKKKIVIAGGYRPGRSTDYVAVMLAEKYGIKTIINLSNIDYVYDRNPHKYKIAKNFTNISWPDFIKIVGSKWDPGLSAPFDPVASQKARELGLTVIIMNGTNLKNLQNYLANKKFKGTIINS